MANPILQIKNLAVGTDVSGNSAPILQNISLTLYQGESLALVGPSGTGKTMLALSILGLLPSPLRLCSGEIIYRQESIEDNGKMSFAKLRGRHISMIFQEPLSALNPVFKIGSVMREIIQIHHNFSKREARKQALAWLELVGLSEPDSVYQFYPHQLSGGMAQRILIALALICRPEILIADEPTSSLDVTTQFQILTLLKQMQARFGFALLLISHDSNLVSELADRRLLIEEGKLVRDDPMTETQNKENVS